MSDPDSIPPSYSYAATMGWFTAGAAITLAFSASLAVHATNASLVEVLAVGMIVPSFTWLIQLTASALFLPEVQRQRYWGNLGRTCVVGSVALLPAALANFFLPGTPLWFSAANVLVSVIVMALDLIHGSTQQGLNIAWPLSWCLTITANMLLFLWVSRSWWLAT